MEMGRRGDDQFPALLECAESVKKCDRVGPAREGPHTRAPRGNISCFRIVRRTREWTDIGKGEGRFPFPFIVKKLVPVQGLEPRTPRI